MIDETETNPGDIADVAAVNLDSVVRQRDELVREHAADTSEVAVLTALVESLRRQRDDLIAERVADAQALAEVTTERDQLLAVDASPEM